MKEIIIKDLVKEYSDIKAVDNLNLDINKGELFSLLGVNGAGKTTSIKMLTCLLLPTSGNIKINGLDIIKDCDKIKAMINSSPQETAVAPNLTVYENLDFFAGIYNIKNKEEVINELINNFNLSKFIKKKAKNLSGGIMRKLSIAISLINDPEILYLDEPTLGLDVIARHELWNIINLLKGKKTIILTTHYMEEAEKLSDRIGILKEGKLLEVGTFKELKDKYHTKSLEDTFIKITLEENK